MLPASAGLLGCFVLAGRQSSLRSAPAVTPVIGPETLQKRIMGGLLEISLYGRVNNITVVVGAVTESLHHLLPDHFGNVISVNFDHLPVKGRCDRRILCDESLAFIDHPQIGHPA